MIDGRERSAGCHAVVPWAVSENGGEGSGSGSRNSAGDSIAVMTRARKMYERICGRRGSSSGNSAGDGNCGDEKGPENVRKDPGKNRPWYLERRLPRISVMVGVRRYRKRWRSRSSVVGEGTTAGGSVRKKQKDTLVLNGTDTCREKE